MTTARELVVPDQRNNVFFSVFDVFVSVVMLVTCSDNQQYALNFIYRLRFCRYRKGK